VPPEVGDLQERLVIGVPLGQGQVHDGQLDDLLGDAAPVISAGTIKCSAWLGGCRGTSAVEVEF
jgi:hypothetical protein